MAEALITGPRCVCELQQLVGGDMSTISRHLGMLKQAGIVLDEKRGTNVYYSLTLHCLQTFLSCTDGMLKARAVSQSELHGD